jgi:ABC-2 type transport system ATP-binding protein
MPGSVEAGNPPEPAAEPPAAILVADEVCKRFEDLTAVSPTSIRVAEGKIVGLVGSDGAGKTTLLRMCATMLKPTSGHIRVGGLDVVDQRRRVKDLIGYMPQRFGLYQDLTVSENLDFFMDVFGITGTERVDRRERYLGFSNLLPFVNRKAGDLSGGMKQKLGLACVLVHQPRLLILDEPTNGVDPVSRAEFWEILAEMKQAQMTVLVSTAYLDEGEKCDRLILMHASSVLVEASPATLQLGYADLEQAMIDHIQRFDPRLTEEKFGH